ncbi:MAG: 50S ribosomal protein L25/general stress protein Ctc [Pseudomonadota bacterium]
MSDKIDLVAEFREDQGKGASRRLRKEGKVPAILYGGGRPPRSISLQHNKLIRALEDESFYSSILNIQVGDKNQETILKDLQRHPAKQQILHVDLQRIVADEEIRTNVPLHFVGEDVCPGIKMQGGVASHLITDVEVICLPRNLPEYLEVDASELELDGIVHLSEIKLPEGVQLPDLTHGEVNDQPVLAIIKPRGPSVDDSADEADGDAAAADAAEGGSDD